MLWKKLSVKWHPDKYPAGPQRERAKEMFKILNQAQ